MNANRPRVIITVSGGVADILQNDGADVEIWDYDNCECCNPDQTNPYESDYCPDFCTDQRGM